MTITLVKWTVEQYHRMIEAGILDECQVELLSGEIIEMSPEGTPHASLSTRAAEYLRQLLGDRVQVREGKPITLATSEPQPDLAIVQRVEDDYWNHHPYPDNIFWLVEFSHSSLEKDREMKRKVYATAGIAEYWLVNLQTMQLTVFRSPQEGDYQSQSTLDEGRLYPLTFPRVAVEVSRFLKK